MGGGNGDRKKASIFSHKNSIKIKPDLCSGRTCLLFKHPLLLGEGFHPVPPTFPPLLTALHSWPLPPLSRVRERNKPAYEINREACDDYKLCERYAMVYGYNAAYNRYFRQRRGAK